MNLIFALFFTAQLYAGALGGFVSNGADRHRAGEGAWFLGREVIRVCSPESNVLLAFERSLNIWATYIAEKKVFGAMEAPFSLKSEIVPCDGTEDLRIELGQGEAFSRVELEENLNRPKGKIILKEEVLRSPEALATQLLHQVGHLLGNDHIPGTVMNDTVAESLAPHLTIDGDRELFLSNEARMPGYQEETERLTIGNLSIRYLTDLASSSVSDGYLFVTPNNAGMRSRGFSRIGRAVIDGKEAQVLVLRNYGIAVEVRLLPSGQSILRAGAE